MRVLAEDGFTFFIGGSITQVFADVLSTIGELDDIRHSLLSDGSLESLATSMSGTSHCDKPVIAFQ